MGELHFYGEAPFDIKSLKKQTLTFENGTLVGGSGYIRPSNILDFNEPNINDQVTLSQGTTYPATLEAGYFYNRLDEANVIVSNLDTQYHLAQFEFTFTIPDTLIAVFGDRELYILFDITVRRTDITKVLRSFWFDFKSLTMQFPSAIQPNPVLFPSSVISARATVSTVAGFFTALLVRTNPKLVFNMEYKLPKSSNPAKSLGVEFNMSIVSVIETLKRYIPLKAQPEHDEDLESDSDLSGSFDLLFST